MNNKIKLAEAMGLKKSTRYRDIRHQQRVSCGEEDAPESSYNFDPFTDANDDYAVLEWMRNNWQGKKGYHGHWNQVATELHRRWDEYVIIVPYKIGDYARAALKVIKSTETHS